MSEEQALSFEEKLFYLLTTNDNAKDAEAKAMLKFAPSDFDVNWINENHYAKRSFLHIACQHNRTEMIAELLNHPMINVNLKDAVGWTPFILTCFSNTVKSAILLLNDARVDINCKDKNGVTGLMEAAWQGNLETIEQILASLKHIQNEDIANSINDAKKEICSRKKEQYPKIISLLEAYQTQPFETVKKLRSKLQEYDSVSIFVLVVLLADDYYSLKLKTDGNHNAIRFFNMMLKLPMDLQMVICNRLFELPKNVIQAKLVNLALKLMLTDRILK